MNENENKNSNVNEIPDEKEKPEPPVVDGKDKDEIEKPESPVINGEDKEEKEKPEPPVVDGEDKEKLEKPEPPVVDGKDKDEIEKPEPPVIDGQDKDDDTNDVTKPVANTSSIFGFVKNLFSSVTSQFNFSFNFGNFFNASPLHNFRQFVTAGFNQTFSNIFQSTARNLFPNAPQFQNFNSTQTQFAYTTKDSTVMTLDQNGDKEVWLNENSEEVTINATDTKGSNILAGNNKDNQIFGGYGHNEMWGGSYKTNDYLFGGAGQNTFWYGKGEGVDLVENTKKGDTINLYNITIGDISNVEITDNSISIVVGEEGVAVNSSDEVSPTFKLSNGETYNYNRSSAEWQKA